MIRFNFASFMAFLGSASLASACFCDGADEAPWSDGFDAGVDVWQAPPQSQDPDGGGQETGTTAPGTTLGSCVPGALPASAQWLLFDSLRDLNRDLYAVNTATCEIKRVTHAASAETFPVASPTGDRLAFESTAPGTKQILIANLASGVAAPLTRMPAGAEQPSWSPDGKSIAFVSGGDVYVMAVAEGAVAQKIPLPALPGIETYELPQFFGENLLINAGRRVRIVTRTGQAIRDIIEPGTSDPGRVVVLEPQQLVVFQAFCGTPALQIRTAPLGASTLACAGTGIGPGWTPAVSGESLIAVSMGGFTENRQIAVYRANQPPRAVTDGRHDDRNPWWLPAGVALPAAPLVIE